MKKISICIGIDTFIGVVVLICLFNSEKSFFLYGLIGLAFLLAGATYYTIQQIFQWINEKLYEQEEKNITLSKTWDIKLTSFMEACKDNNKQLVGTIEKMAKYQEEHLSEIREINHNFKGSVMEAIITCTKTYENHKEEVEKLEKERNSFTVQWLTNLSEAQGKHRSEMSKMNEEFRGSIRGELTELDATIKDSYERIEKVTITQSEFVQKYASENNELIQRIENTNKALNNKLSNYYESQEELFRANHEKLIQSNVNNQKELSASIETSLSEIKILVADLAEFVVNFSEEYNSINSNLMDGLSSTIEQGYEDNITKFNRESKKLTDSIKEIYENYNKIHISSVEEVNKLFAKIVCSQEKLLKNMDEREEAYRQMNAEDIMIMKEILG